MPILLSLISYKMNTKRIQKPHQKLSIDHADLLHYILLGLFSACVQMQKSKYWIISRRINESKILLQLLSIMINNDIVWHTSSKFNLVMIGAIQNIWVGLSRYLVKLAISCSSINFVNHYNPTCINTAASMVMANVEMSCLISITKSI